MRFGVRFLALMGILTCWVMSCTQHIDTPPQPTEPSPEKGVTQQAACLSIIKDPDICLRTFHYLSSHPLLPDLLVTFKEDHFLITMSDFVIKAEKQIPCTQEEEVFKDPDNISELEISFVSYEQDLEGEVAYFYLDETDPNQVSEGVPQELSLLFMQIEAQDFDPVAVSLFLDKFSAACFYIPAASQVQPQF